MWIKIEKKKQISYNSLQVLKNLMLRKIRNKMNIRIQVFLTQVHY